MRKTIGDVQQFRDEREAALLSYEQALSLFRQVGDRLGEANVSLALGLLKFEEDNSEQAFQLVDYAYQLYKAIGDGYSQARLLYYRSQMYETMQECSPAIADVETALALATALQLPFVELFEQRLHDLREQCGQG